VSNTVQYDPVLVRSLADELRDRLRGRPCGAAPILAPDLSVTLPLDRGEQLRIDLHPSRGWFRLLPDPAGEDLELDAHVTSVDAPADERVLRLGLHETGRFRRADRTLVIELHTNQWNTLLLDEEERILSVLRSRRAGGRSLFPGETYRPPAPAGRVECRVGSREDVRATWMEELASCPPSELRGRVLSRFAYTGAMNAGWILEPAMEGGDLAAAFERWWWLCAGPERRPHVLLAGNRRAPYPVPLEGIPGEPAPGLLEAMASVADEVRPAEADPQLERAAAFVARRLGATERKRARLEGERASTAEAPRIRAWGDLLLARFHEVPRGADRVRLEGWEGETVEIPLDPQLGPAENAARHYDRAGRLTRAEAQLPALLEAAEEEARGWRAMAEEVARGVVSPRLAALLQRAEREPDRASSRQTGLPYRRFRTSGGLEVRVGRTSRDNDRLTFRESSPGDVWLHARSVAGSHVILRWQRSDESPPARDLHEAAQLAAVFSKARTSGTVAVDWTRRKHVRKPRGAAPGLVIPQHAKTIFVEPDPAVVDRLADDD
jgi:hypothetical protein